MQEVRKMKARNKISKEDTRELEDRIVYLQELVDESKDKTGIIEDYIEEIEKLEDEINDIIEYACGV